MRSYVSRLTALTLAAALGLLAASPGAARGEENWPHWRGPHFNGSSDAKNLPEKFGKGETSSGPPRCRGRATAPRSSGGTACS